MSYVRQALKLVPMLGIQELTIKAHQQGNTQNEIALPTCYRFYFTSMQMSVINGFATISAPTPLDRQPRLMSPSPARLNASKSRDLQCQQDGC
jgi:hypothetical protein